MTVWVLGCTPDGDGGDGQPETDGASDTHAENDGTGQVDGTSTSGPGTSTATSTTGSDEGGSEGDSDTGSGCTQMLPEIKPDVLPEFVVGEPVSVQFSVYAEFDYPLQWVLVDAPDTLSINDEGFGLMTGTFEDTETTSLRVYVEELDPANGCPAPYSSRDYEITVNP